MKCGDDLDSLQKPQHMRVEGFSLAYNSFVGNKGVWPLQHFRSPSVRSGDWLVRQRTNQEGLAEADAALRGQSATGPNSVFASLAMFCVPLATRKPVNVCIRCKIELDNDEAQYIND